MLFNHKHPLCKEDGQPNEQTIALREQLLKDYFIDGLPSDLQNRVRYKTFECFDDLVELTNTYAVNYDEEREERTRMRETINAVHGHRPVSNPLTAETIANIVKSTVEGITKHASADIAEIKKNSLSASSSLSSS